MRNPQTPWPREKLATVLWSKVAKGADCWEWQAGRDTYGYGQQWDGATNRRSHVLAYDLTFGDRAEGQCVLHTCDNPPCCNPKHLFLGSKKDNSEDMVAKGRSIKGRQIARNRGENNPRAKITEEQALEVIRRYRLYRENRPLQIARDLGVVRSLVGEIISGRAWKHLPRV